ncbi:hypothetical protein MCOR25_001031 [Pyricularia grisea]|uniref:Uncharacterized protein n=1 Tax=Pyricularia grisea TaxID=148305 RepID=A0A6P8AZY3_PYRGI|nr:hypothetical protein PgNI_10682 [Pyricularia grisea]KAI6381800.1 hypothetical protein MCOR25_001031 [Pyricularia grisea]TLD07874.1 hypothetical protein PgNI_10682 [Pyricularia grisea]
MSTALDNELESLRKRAEHLRAEVKLRASTLLLNPVAATHILDEQPTQAAPAPALLLPTPPSKSRSKSSSNAPLGPKQRDLLKERRAKQATHDQRNTYRTCAGITTFKVRDPDPAAVDGGAVLGVRIEVMRSARFMRPFYVLLNRPWEKDAAAKRYLRVHRHTLPAAIPLAGLAARYLPVPRSASSGKQPRQDLGAFVRRLRRELVRYHQRLGAVSDLRAIVGLDDKSKAHVTTPADERPEAVVMKSIEDDRESRARQRRAVAGIVDIEPVDTAATQFRFDWRDGRVGRLVIGPGGEVLQSVVVLPDGGRDRVTQQDVFGDCARIEDVVAKLRGPLGGT